MSPLKNWFRHGFLNTFEHASTRALDAFNSLVIIWVLNPEVFSTLALAQAHVAPLLLFFVAPETTFYRDFARWKKEGDGVLNRRLRVFRGFSWFKLILALILTGILVGLTPFWSQALGRVSLEDRFFGFIWAFSMALAPQISGTDREYLRLSLRLESLNLLTWIQKILLLSATVGASFFFPNSLKALGVLTLVAAVATAWVAAVMSQRSLGATPVEKVQNEQSAIKILSEAIQSYSLWTHLAGVIQGWVQTLDVFLLGIFKFPARELGLFAAAAKLSNLSLAMPMALSNLWSIWVGRRLANSKAERVEEVRILKKISLGMGVVLLVQSGVLVALAPWFFSALARGRWSEAEQAQVRSWFWPMTLGAATLGSAYFTHCWIWLRKDAARFFRQVYLPWGLVVGIALYALIEDGMAESARWAGVVSGCTMILLLGVFWVRNRGVE